MTTVTCVLTPLIWQARIVPLTGELNLNEALASAGSGRLTA